MNREPNRDVQEFNDEEASHMALPTVSAFL